ncbi:hypothetical protein OH76DRAFT_1424242, partial [Lentinus brumalis]
RRSSQDPEGTQAEVYAMHKVADLRSDVCWLNGRHDEPVMATLWIPESLHPDRRDIGNNAGSEERSPARVPKLGHRCCCGMSRKHTGLPTQAVHFFAETTSASGPRSAACGWKPGSCTAGKRPSFIGVATVETACFVERSSSVPSKYKIAEGSDALRRTSSRT